MFIRERYIAADIAFVPLPFTKPVIVEVPVPPLTTCTVPDNVEAAAAIVISALPSNATPLIFLGAANFVAVAAFPVVF